jgi:hypothetical protein
VMTELAGTTDRDVAGGAGGAVGRAGGGGEPEYVPFEAGHDPDDPVDHAILRTRAAVFPLHGLAAE